MPKLVDLDWKFAVTASSDELQVVGGSLLQLKMSLDTGDGKIEHVAMEMTLPQFYQFLHEMGKMKAVMDTYGS
ncbi:hypothetical protein CYMTET_18723 [Cymbomonas tetramitiformis]|uniref:COMM domain-containing protein n=1 Tax=Cymbomonas tetramitiformis TaxID=36881 RepID=A0AAE0G7H9_9CHLO|nr:hypothetical protein CYMTET_18723 [Cymbomonas tetramitiformis]